MNSPRFLYLDTETFSRIDLKTGGTYRYAEESEIMMIQYAIDDGPVFIWDHNDGTPPPDLAAYLRDNPRTIVVAHNAMFDRTVLRLGNLRIEIPIERWWCTSVQALQHALPNSLAQVGELLGLPDDAAKSKDGRKLIQRFCKPAPSNHKADRYTKQTHPEEWQRFRDYGGQDIVALREVHRRLPTWNWRADDLAAWHLDQHINDRGFAVDTELTAAGARAAMDEKAYLAHRFAELTNGLKPTQRDKTRDYINLVYGLRLEGTAKHIMIPISEDDTKPDSLREIARIVLAANKTSTAKYATLAAATSSDGRFRGGLQFAGARRTRRWAGRVFQPQNLPSRGLPKADLIALYIEALKVGCQREVFDDLMLYGAAALRGVVIAS